MEWELGQTSWEASLVLVYPADSSFVVAGQQVAKEHRVADIASLEDHLE